ncbi:MAG: helix-turn-helix domain-containing protein [Prevotella sp.]|jgi:AraC-like DNA-binding protein
MNSEMNQDISVSSYKDTFFFCHVGSDRLCEKMVTEHTLFYLVSGEMDVFTPDGKTVHLKKGDTCLLRRNHKVDKEKRCVRGEAFNGLFLHLKMDFLKRVKKEQHIVVPAKTSKIIRNQNVFSLPRHPFLQGLFKSLIDYFNADVYPSKDILESKLREAVFIILQLRPQLASVLFDFAAPYKIDVSEFMEENFLSDLTVEQFAHYTGRSLTSFKHDFNEAFHITPQRWLTKRRLQEARRMMEETGRSANDVYLEAGFKNLSHFSTAFKKEYGFPPSQLKAHVG